MSTTISARISGGCRCGAVRYEAEGAPWNLTVCHCQDCRGATGAPMVGWLTVRRDACRFTAEPAWFRSSPRAERGFCPSCGTPLAYRADALPDEIDLTMASLDDPERFPPRDQVWVSRRLSWVALAPGLPAHPRARGS
ncbi:GFA family protein [Methylobacterium aquaticum]|uniref:GFA family protein n=1 Tax=Methylobacterium aquaticum TaxID=270351 RepID=UPI0019333C5A|nr:GFA family protein [Methylobacterium aquaticum]QRE73018.1 GFA family protein [Methylobacterium aquaticum]